MARLKVNRFKAPPPPPEVQRVYLREYKCEDLHYRLDDLPPLSPETVFDNSRPMVLDLGCGRGDFVIARASEDPYLNVLGLDLHAKSLYDAARKAHRAGLANVRFVRTDLRGALRKVPDGCVLQAFMLFPPPIVEKNRQQKDLLPEDTVRQIHRVLVPGGMFHLVTDSPAYFDLKIGLIDALGLFELTGTSQEFEGGITWYQRLWEGFEIESKRAAFRK